MRVTSGVAGAFRRHPLLADGLLALALVLFSVSGLWAGNTPEDEFREPDALAVLLTLAGSAVLALRRKNPVVTFAVTVITGGTVAALDYVAVGGIAVLVALYSLTAWRGQRLGLAGLAVATVGTLLVLATAPMVVRGFDYVANVAVLVAVWALGRAMRMRRAYVAELERRLEQVQATRDADTRAVVAQERGRIARELHDVVAHHVSVMTVQATAARRTVHRDATAAAAAMAAVERTGRQALVEMRRIVGVLRNGDEPASGELSPPPGLADLPALVEQVRTAGLPVQHTVVGTARPLDEGVGLIAYRIVQEALTNSLQHAGPARADVAITYGNRELTVEVSDNGRGASAALTSQPRRVGHGLLGMRERVAVAGGRLTVGPRPGGGFEVRATLPLEVGAA